VDGRETAVAVVSFQVDGRSYALPLEQVVEVLRMVAVTPVPDAPPWIAGVVNLRGKLLPMIDLRPRLGAAPTEIDPDHVFLVAQTAGKTVGVMADLVEDVVEVADSAINESPSEGGVVGGFARLSAGALVILDLERLAEGTDLVDQGRGEVDVTAHSVPA
jgi:purine-binding chemotaxis protein CheW